MFIELGLTVHAQDRMRERSIEAASINGVLDYGIRQKARDGALEVRLDKNGRRQLARDIGRQVFERIRDLLDIRLIVSEDERVITVMRAAPSRRVRKTISRPAPLYSFPTSTRN